MVGNAILGPVVGANLVAARGNATAKLKASLCPSFRLQAFVLEVVEKGGHLSDGSLLVVMLVARFLRLHGVTAWDVRAADAGEVAIDVLSAGTRGVLYVEL